MNTNLLDVWIKFLVRINLLNQFLELALAEQTVTTVFVEAELGLLDETGGAHDVVGRHVCTTGESGPARRHLCRYWRIDGEGRGNWHFLGSCSVVTVHVDWVLWWKLTWLNRNLLAGLDALLLLLQGNSLCGSGERSLVAGVDRCRGNGCRGVDGTLRDGGGRRRMLLLL